MIVVNLENKRKAKKEKEEDEVTNDQKEKIMTVMKEIWIIQMIKYQINVIPMSNMTEERVKVEIQIGEKAMMGKGGYQIIEEMLIMDEEFEKLKLKELQMDRVKIIVLIILDSVYCFYQINYVLNDGVMDLRLIKMMKKMEKAKLTEKLEI
ncbi:MAG: hypothetical protein EZS28_011864 [Streblomastix strix]|uniref:Uncharacterized protein n=1 Tax=Streblomastix strix TaxID=222440 RepID=A0A5J4WCI7_9EUKA|nr:MAG: hypothetical protein EZS28_011864 [Streblomastix strix]